MNFGSSVSIDNGLAVVGALHDNALGRSAGSAYLFDVATGKQLAKLTASDAAIGDEFGVSVDVEDGTVIVGSHMDGSGSAYLFDAASGEQLMKLRAADAAEDDLFGVAVALSEGRALVGARYDDDLGIASGSAYLFDVATGQQLHKLNAHDGVRGDRYGMHLDLSGDVAVIGARYDDDEKKSSGSAYVYDVNSGAQRFKLVPDDTTRNDQFGSAISISGDVAVIGALDDDHNGPYAGSAYLFNVRTGEQLYKFNAIDATPFDRMGIAAAMDGDTVVIGASMLNHAAAVNATGKAYVYTVPEPSGTAVDGVGVGGLAIQPSRASQPLTHGTRSFVAGAYNGRYFITDFIGAAVMPTVTAARATAASRRLLGSGTAARGPCSNPPDRKAETKSVLLNSVSPFQSPVAQTELPGTSSSYSPATNTLTKSLLLNSPSRFASPK